jgi:hypothetical protein
MEQLTLGFTGTSKGMTMRQLKEVRNLLYSCGTLHLGDCVGADTEAYHIAGETGIHRVGHPPSDGKARSFLDYEETRSELPYMERNLAIAREGVDGLVAAPQGWVEINRGRDGGTWSTVRRARSLGRRIWIVRPDGSVMVEAAGVSKLHRRGVR